MTNQLKNNHTCDSLKKIKKSVWKYSANVEYESSHELRQGRAERKTIKLNEDILSSSRIYVMDSIFVAFI
jgi:hypothetical protein